MTDRVERLTEKQRECLRLVWRHQESKDIARALGISPHSVDGRIKTAMRALGVEDRYEAARLLVQAEAESIDQRLIYPPSDVHVGPHPAPSPFSFEPGERRAEHLVVEEPQAAFQLSPGYDASWFKPPLPTNGRRANDLNVAARLFWVVIIAIGAALSFGVLATGLEALSRLT